MSYLVRTPRVPFFMLDLIGLEAKGLLAFQGRRGIASVVRWNLRLVIAVEDIRRDGISGFRMGFFRGGERHININFLLWLTSRWPWDKRLVVPGLTGQKVYAFASKRRKYKLFPLVNRRVVPTFRSLCVQSLCAFSFLIFGPLKIGSVLSCCDEATLGAESPSSAGFAWHWCAVLPWTTKSLHRRQDFIHHHRCPEDQ